MLPLYSNSVPAQMYRWTDTTQHDWILSPNGETLLLPSETWQPTETYRLQTHLDLVSHTLRIHSKFSHCIRLISNPKSWHRYAAQCTWTIKTEFSYRSKSLMWL